MLSPVPDNETETGKNSPSLEQSEEKTKSPTRVKTQAPLILSVSQLDGGNNPDTLMSPPTAALGGNTFQRSGESHADSSSSVGDQFNRETLEQDRRESQPSALSRCSNVEIKH